MKLKTSHIIIPAIMIVLFTIQFVSYCLSRELGDATFLGIAMAITCSSIWVFRTLNTRIISLITSLLVTCALLITHSYWASFVRTEHFDLAEDFGTSALKGIVIFAVILPLSALSGAFSALLWKSKHNP